MSASLASAGRGGKIAGLPSYVWLGVIAGGLLLGLWLRSRGGGGGNTAALDATSSYPISLPSGPGADTGSVLGALGGNSLGGGSDVGGAMDPSVISDLLNQEAATSADVQGLTQQMAGLTDALGAVVFSQPSSGGSGASSTGKKPHPGNKHGHDPHPKRRKAAHKHPHKKKAVHR